MLRRFINLLLMGLFVFALPTPVFADQPVYVIIDGFLQDTRYTARLFVDDEGYVLISQEDVVPLFGRGFMPDHLTHYVETEDGVMYSLRDVTRLNGWGMTWAAHASTVRLYSHAPVLSMFGSIERQAQRADDITIFTFEQALERINERDQRLANARTNRTLINRDYQALERRIVSQGLVGETDGRYSMAQIELLRTRERLTTQQRQIGLNEQIWREGNEFTLRNTLASLSRTELDIIQLEATIAFDERGLALLELMYEMGFETEASLRDARLAIERGRVNLASLRTSLAEQRLAFNHLLGLRATDVVEITGYNWNLQMPQDLERHERRLMSTLSGAPTLQMRHADLRLAWFMEHSYIYLLRPWERTEHYFYHADRYRDNPHATSTAIELRSSVTAAQNALDNHRDAMHRHISTTYNNIAQLREQIRATTLDLSNARIVYEEAMVRYMVGVASWQELERAQRAILNHEIALARHEINLGMLIFDIQRPYLDLARWGL